MAYVSKFRCDMYNLAKCNKQFHSTTIQKLLQNFGSQWFISGIKIDSKLIFSVTPTHLFCVKLLFAMYQVHVICKFCGNSYLLFCSCIIFM